MLKLRCNRSGLLVCERFTWWKIEPNLFFGTTLDQICVPPVDRLILTDDNRVTAGMTRLSEAGSVFTHGAAHGGGVVSAEYAQPSRVQPLMLAVFGLVRG